VRVEVVSVTTPTVPNNPTSISVNLDVPERRGSITTVNAWIGPVSVVVDVDSGVHVQGLTHETRLPCHVVVADAPSPDDLVCGIKLTHPKMEEFSTRRSAKVIRREFGMEREAYCAVPRS